MKTNKNEDLGTVEVFAINLPERLVLLADQNTVLHMDSLHEADGTETEDVDEAVFATVQTPDGKWFTVTFSDYEVPRNGYN